MEAADPAVDLPHLSPETQRIELKVTTIVKDAQEAPPMTGCRWVPREISEKTNLWSRQSLRLLKNCLALKAPPLFR